MLWSSSTMRMVPAISERGLPWCWWPDSNGRPTDYESVALPAELHQRYGREPRIIRQALPRPPRRDRVHVLLRRFAPFAPPLAPLVAGLCPGADEIGRAHV